MIHPRAEASGDPVKRMITVGGRQFVIDEEEPTHYLFWNEVEAGNWEPYTFEALDRVLQPGSGSIDVGAWLGAVSLDASSLGAERHAIEPDPAADATLCRNVMANPCLKIAASPLAMADQEGHCSWGVSAVSGAA